MFDFFRDLYFETHGIDSEEAEKERAIKKQKKRKTYFYFPGRIKALIIGMGILFLALQMFQIKATAARGIMYLLATIMLCVLAVVIMILLLMKNKRAEFTAAILLGVFIVCEYLLMLASILII